MDFSQYLTPGVVAGIGTLLVGFLNSPPVQGAIKSLTAKLDAEAAMAASAALHNKNAFVREMVVAAMAYAEQHEPDVLKAFKSKADFVIAKVTADPRYASLGVPAETVAHIIEDIFESVYDTAAHSGDHPAA